MKTKLFIILFLTSFLNRAQGQIIDLSKASGTVQKRNVNSEEFFKIEVTNLLPNYLEAYKITVELRQIPMEKLEMPTEDEYGIDISKDCQTLKSEIDSLYKEVNEEIFPKKMANLKKEIEKKLNSKDTINSCYFSINEELKKLENSITKTIWEGKLLQDEQIIVTISREIDSISKSWTYIFSTKPRGEWQASVGYTMIIPYFMPSKNYYSESNGSNYIIKKSNDKQIQLEYIPTAFFSWEQADTKCKNKNFRFGLSGGLGLDTKEISFFSAGTLSYNQNLKFHIGIGAHQINRLKDEYYEGKELKENLSSEQLHKKVFGVNPFVSVSFRFNQKK